MSLREQFEAWVLRHKPAMWGFENETAWQAYQAGHAASGRDELLEALESLYGAIDSCVDLTPEVLQQARLAIKKARGE